MTITFFSLIIASLLVMLVSLSGVVFIWSYLKPLMEGNLRYLVSFSAGVFLIVSINLIIETLALSSTASVGIASVLLGFLLIHLIQVVFPESHHHHEHEREECGHRHTRREAYRILVSDAIHNIGDGLLLVPAFVTDIWLGVTATIGVLVHEGVQEISEFFVLRESGYTTTQALLRNFLVSSTILIGTIGGFFLASLESLISLLLGLAAGGFLHVVALDLIPRSLSYTRNRGGYIRSLVAACAGAVLILGVNTIVPHGHPADEQPHNDVHEH